MTFKSFIETFHKLVLSVFIILLPIAAFGNKEEVIAEKRIGVVMRTIGHEVLKCYGDNESRVMPIEKLEDHYKISFEFEFGFDADDIITIVDEVMTETGIARHYFVEVEECDSNKVVHSFEITSRTNTNLIACKGRILPKDCYSILVTLLDGIAPTLVLPEKKNIDSPITEDAQSTESSLFQSPFLIIPLLSIIGFISYLIKRKSPSEIDPNILSLGAYQLDKRNRTLSFDNNTVELSHKEAELLLLLHHSANEPIEREILLQKVWGDEGDYVGRTLDVFISKLRKKLEADPNLKIVNIRGVGYKLLMAVRR